MQGTAPLLSPPASVMAVKPPVAFGSGTLSPSQHQVSVVTAAPRGDLNASVRLLVMSSVVEFVDIVEMVDMLLISSVVGTEDLHIHWLWVGERGRVARVLCVCVTLSFARTK